LGVSTVGGFSRTPQLYIRSKLEEISLLWQKEIAYTIGNKFRTAFDAQQRILYMHYVSEGGLGSIRASKQADVAGVFRELADDEYRMVRFGDSRHEFIHELNSAIARPPLFLCINDEINTGVSARDDALRAILSASLQHLFPQQSAYEKEGPTPAPQIRSSDTGDFINLRISSEPTAFGTEPLTILWRGGGHASWLELGANDYPVHVGPGASLQLVRQRGHVSTGYESAESVTVRIPVIASRAAGHFCPERNQEREVSILVDIELVDVCEIEHDAVLAEIAGRVSFIDGIVAHNSRFPGEPVADHRSLFARAKLAVETGLVDGRTITMLDTAELFAGSSSELARIRMLAAIQLGDATLIRSAVSALIACGPQAVERVQSLIIMLRTTGQIGVARVLAEALAATPSAAKIGLAELLRIKLDIGEPVEADFDELVADDSTEEEIAVWTSGAVQTNDLNALYDARRTLTKFVKPNDEPSIVAVSSLRLHARRQCLLGDGGPRELDAAALKDIKRATAHAAYADALISAAFEAMGWGRTAIALAILQSLRIAHPTSAVAKTALSIARVLSGERPADFIFTEAACRWPNRAEFELLCEPLLSAGAILGEDIRRLALRIASLPEGENHLLKSASWLKKNAGVGTAGKVLDAAMESAPANPRIAREKILLLTGAAGNGGGSVDLIRLGSEAGLSESWLGYVRCLEKAGDLSTGSPNKPTAKTSMSIAFADEENSLPEQQRTQIITEIRRYAAAEDAWHAMSPSGVLWVGMKDNSGCPIYLFFDLTDRDRLVRPEFFAALAKGQTRFVLVPGQWTRRRVLAAAPGGDLAGVKVIAVGAPRVDYLRRLRDERDVAAKSDRPRILFATVSNRFVGKDGRPLGIRRHAKDIVTKLAEVADVQVLNEPGNLVEKKVAAVDELLDCSVLVTDYTSLAFEAWALGKPVIFPRWLTGDRIIEEYPNSAEGHIYRERIGYHAQSLEELMEAVGTVSEPGLDVAAFMSEYLDNFENGNAAKRIAHLLEVIADPSSQESLKYHLDQARLAADEGNLSKSADMLRGLLDAYPDDPDIQSALAKALEGLGDAEAASELLRNAIGTAPHNAALLAQLGALEARLGRYRSAARYLERASISQGDAVPVEWLRLLAQAQEAEGSDGPPDFGAAAATYLRISTAELIVEQSH
jgi:hypothetical protein